MTPSKKPAHPGQPAGLFRPADHVLVIPQGSAMAILDLERGVVYATTPEGAESWHILMGEARPPRRRMVKDQAEPEVDEESRARAGVAAYLFDRGIIKPVTR